MQIYSGAHLACNEIIELVCGRSLNKNVRAEVRLAHRRRVLLNSKWMGIQSGITMGITKEHKLQSVHHGGASVLRLHSEESLRELNGRVEMEKTSSAPPFPFWRLAGCHFSRCFPLTLWPPITCRLAS